MSVLRWELSHATRSPPSSSSGVYATPPSSLTAMTIRRRMSGAAIRILPGPVSSVSFVAASVSRVPDTMWRGAPCLSPLSPSPPYLCGGRRREIPAVPSPQLYVKPQHRSLNLSSSFSATATFVPPLAPSSTCRSELRESFPLPLLFFSSSAIGLHRVTSSLQFLPSLVSSQGKFALAGIVFLRLSLVLSMASDPCFRSLKLVAALLCFLGFAASV